MKKMLCCFALNEYVQRTQRNNGGSDTCCMTTVVILLKAKWKDRYLAANTDISHVTSFICLLPVQGTTQYSNIRDVEASQGHLLVNACTTGAWRSSHIRGHRPWGFVWIFKAVWVFGFCFNVSPSEKQTNFLLRTVASTRIERFCTLRGTLWF